jgi:hypothetical protein
MCLRRVSFKPKRSERPYAQEVYPSTFAQALFKLWHLAVSTAYSSFLEVL